MGTYRVLLVICELPIFSISSTSFLFNLAFSLPNSLFSTQSLSLNVILFKQWREFLIDGTKEGLKFTKYFSGNVCMAEICNFAPLKS